MSGAAKIDFAALLEPVTRRLWGEPNPALSSSVELRWGTHGSRSADLKEHVWFDHEANEGGGTVALIKREKGFSGKDAVNWLVAEGLVSKPNGAARIIANYDYVDESGTLLFQVCRYDPKGFKQRRPNGKGWIWKLGDTRRVLYNLLRLIEAVACEQVVLIVEGEKDVENLRRLNVVATCNPEGAGKWRGEFNEAFRGADVVLVPDNDEAGYAHIGMVGAALTGIARRIRVLLLPGLPDKGDASDWIAAGGTAEQLWSLVGQAPDWVPPAVDANGGANADPAKAKAAASEQDLIDRLAALPPIEYDQQRKQAARDLGVRGSTLDDEVERRRGERQVVPLHGYWVVEPWETEVGGDALLDDIICRLRRHVVFERRQAIASALWTVMAWVHEEAATHSPILLATSAEANSGKTTLINLIGFLVPRGLSSVGIPEAALFRSIELWQPTIIVDEADTALVDNEPLRAVINSGWTRGTGAIRCIGESHTPHLFPTFAPKALGMKGRRLPDTTISRCIIIDMQRKRPGERADHFKHIDDDGLAELRRKALRWAIDNGAALKAAAEPEMPGGFDNRIGDNWRLLFQIAEQVGGDWPVRAREAAAALSGKAAEDASIGVKLLGDIRTIFAEKGTDRLASAGFCEALAAVEDRPWVEWKAGKPITPNGLARLLKPFDIRPDTIRVGPDATAKGYQLAQFTEAFERYL